jgi:hypothetical protein
MCNNKLYKKFFIFSSAFLILSIIINSLIVYAATVTPQRPRNKITKKIRQQQRVIIDRLNNIEKNKLIKINGR